MSVSVEQTPLPGVVVITPVRFGDHRGFFSESYSAEALAEHGITTGFVQDNHSLSMTQGTIRGLHFQAPPHAQDKLVRCGRGALFDVAVDIRKGSPTRQRLKLSTNVRIIMRRRPRGPSLGMILRSELTGVWVT
mgnify:CR=1 FL=1